MIVKLDFINDPSSTAALELADLTFIIEEPRPSFFTTACKHRDSPHSICRDRWKHIQCFHFVYASPRQAVLYSRLDVPHYSESARRMKLEIDSFMTDNPGLDCILRHHLPDRNSATSFLTVFNVLPPAVDLIFTEIKWDVIAQTPYSVLSSKVDESSVGQQRQFLHADFGNTPGLNQSRVHDPSGLPRPVLLKGTSKHDASLFFKSPKLPSFFPLLLAFCLRLFSLIRITISVTMIFKQLFIPATSWKLYEWR